MEVSTWLTCLCFVGAAVADTFNINKRVDGALPQVNTYLKTVDLNNVTLPDFFLPSAPVFMGVTLEDMSTSVRTGDAFMWQTDEDTIAASVPIGLKEMRVHVESCSFMNGTGFVWTVGNASVEVGFSLQSHNDASCTTTWNYFNITRLDDIIVHTSDPTYDNKPPPPEIMPYIIPHYNKYLNTPDILAIVTKYLNLCDGQSVLA